MVLEEIMEVTGLAFEALGVFIIVAGGLYALVKAIADHSDFERFFKHARRNFGRPMLLGLEVLVAADIIETIAVDRSLEAAAILGILVLVRVLLSFSLDVEIDGIAPWRRARYEAETEEPAS